MEAINSKGFNKKISEFERDEGRGIIYWRAKEIISKNKEFDIEAILLLLTTWNFAHMSSVFKKIKGYKFNYNLIRNSIEKVKPLLKVFEGKSLKSLNLKKFEEEIKTVYRILQENEQIKAVGASKVLMLLNDDVFAAWDGAIIDYYSKYQQRGKKFGKKDGDAYYRFLLLMKEKFGQIILNKENENKGFAKAIDEYNFLIVPRKNKKE